MSKKEKVISFELAKLAYDIGFKYMESNIYGDNLHYHRDDPNGEASALNQNTVRGTYLAPTLSRYQTWLREVYGVYADILSRRPHSDYKGPIFYQTQILHKHSKYTKGHVNSIYCMDDDYIYDKTYEDSLEILLIGVTKWLKELIKSTEH